MSGLNDISLWHDRDQWHTATLFLEGVFRDYRRELGTVMEYAGELRERIDAVSPFIQENTALVCPSCSTVCCKNVHGYYDVHDLIYIYALGSGLPRYGQGLSDGDPCQFLSPGGCRLGRSARPFRCNWYFCHGLTREMENGPARPYRQFVSRFQEAVDLRRQMLDEFSLRVSRLVPQEKGFASLYTNRVKS
jgi:hypothetical protein